MLRHRYDEFLRQISRLTANLATVRRGAPAAARRAQSCRGSAKACSFVVRRTRSPAASSSAWRSASSCLRERVIVPCAVDLEDEPLGRPAQVGEVRRSRGGRTDDERLVDLRVLEALVEHEVEHLVLVAAVRRRRAGGDDRGDAPGVGMAVRTPQHRLELAHARELLGLRLTHEPLQAPVGQLRRDLQDRPRGRCGRDAVDARRVARVQRPRALKADPRAPARRRAPHGDVDRAVIPAHQSRRRARCPLREERFLAPGEHGSHEVRVERLGRVADGVYARSERGAATPSSPGAPPPHDRGHTPRADPCAARPCCRAARCAARRSGGASNRARGATLIRHTPCSQPPEQRGWQRVTKPDAIATTSRRNCGDSPRHGPVCRIVHPQRYRFDTPRAHRGAQPEGDAAAGGAAGAVIRRMYSSSASRPASRPARPSTKM